MYKYNTHVAFPYGTSPNMLWDWAVAQWVLQRGCLQKVPGSFSLASLFGCVRPPGEPWQLPLGINNTSSMMKQWSDLQEAAASAPMRTRFLSCEEFCGRENANKCSWSCKLKKNDASFSAQLSRVQEPAPHLLLAWVGTRPPGN